MNKILLSGLTKTFLKFGEGWVYWLVGCDHATFVITVMPRFVILISEPRFHIGGLANTLLTDIQRT